VGMDRVMGKVMDMIMEIITMETMMTEIQDQIQAEGTGKDLPLVVRMGISLLTLIIMSIMIVPIILSLVVVHLMNYPNHK
jgi:ABC-type phosphate transport system permease subunit